jgi:Ca2+-binding RTX toxin-like protein
MTNTPNRDTSDTFIGTPNADWFFLFNPPGTGAGADRFEGLGGDDLIELGEGADIGFGGDGNDTLRGGAGDDQMYGGDGNDQIVTGTGFDLVDGGGGDDQSDGSASNRMIAYGGSGNDFLTGGDGNDQIYGDAGNDELYGGAGADTVSGGDGNDILTAGDVFTLSNDKIYGGAGDDDVSAAGGDDILSGGAGRDLLRLGRSSDFVDFDLRLGNRTHVMDIAGYGRISVSGFESVWTANGNDRVVGTNGANEIVTGGGDDIVIAKGGSDIIRDGFGNDTIYAGKGDDLIEAFFNQTGGADRDTYFGGGGADVFLFSDPAKSPRATPDTIGDFVRGQDTIDLSDFSLSWDFARPPILDVRFIGRQSFAEDDTAQVRVGRNFFEVDANGDGSADMRVILIGAGVLGRGDFDLG